MCSIQKIYPQLQLSSPVDTFYSAPKLYRVFINSTFSVRHVRMSWAQLTHFWIEVCTRSECLAILTTCHNLENFTFHITNRDWLAAPGSVIIHPRLNTLDISSDCKDLSFLLDHLSFPSLRDLSLSSTVWQKAPFLSLLRRSSCTLERLSLSILDAAADDIMHILQHTTRLTELQLRDIESRIATETLQLLVVSPTPREKTLVPRLRCLSVDICWIGNPYS